MLAKNKSLGNYSENFQKALYSLAEIGGDSNGNVLRHVGGNFSQVQVPTAQNAAAQSRFGSSAKFIKWGGRTLLVVGVAADIYEVYNSDNKARTITKNLGGRTGAGGGAYTFGSFGARAGPRGAAIGSVAGGITGYFSGEYVTKTVYYWIFTPVK